MSLDSDIALLTGTANALINTFEKKSTEIEEKLQEALVLIPDNARTYYVDQVNGSDSNMGDAETPLKSIDEAVARTPFSGMVKVLLLEDYTFESKVNVRNIFLDISPAGEYVGDRVNIYFSARDEDGQVKTGGISTSEDVSINFYKANIHIPDLSSLSGSVGNASCCFGPLNSGPGLKLLLKINYCNVICSTSATYLLTQSLYFIELLVGNSTISADMPGHWVLSVGAGTHVSDIDYISSNGVISL